MVHGKPKLSDGAETHQARDEAARAPSKPIRVLSIIQGHFSHGIEPTPLQKFSSPRYRYSIPVRFLSPSGSVGALVSSSRLSDQINVTRPARYHFFTFTENEKPSWRKMIATGTFNTKPLLSYLSDLLLRDRTCATSTDDVYVSTLATW